MNPRCVIEQYEEYTFQIRYSWPFVNRMKMAALVLISVGMFPHVGRKMDR